MNRITGYVMGVSMHLSHDGLKATALQQRPKIDLDALKPGEFVLFSNNPFTACKIFGSGNTYIYHRNPGNRPMHPRALMAAVQCFDGIKFDYATALQKSIESALSPELKAWLRAHRSELAKGLGKTGVVEKRA